jgi:hypothetical protein
MFLPRTLLSRALPRSERVYFRQRADATRKPLNGHYQADLELDWPKKTKKCSFLGFRYWMVLAFLSFLLGLQGTVRFYRSRAHLSEGATFAPEAALVRLHSAYWNFLEHLSTHCKSAAPRRLRVQGSQVHLAIVRPFSTKHVDLLERRTQDWIQMPHAIPCLRSRDDEQNLMTADVDLIFVYSASESEHRAHDEGFRARLLGAAQPLLQNASQVSCFRQIHFWGHVIDMRESDVHPDVTCDMFYSIMERLAEINDTKYGPYTHFMLMEPDVQPVQAGWLSEGIQDLAHIAAVDGTWVIGSISHNPMDYRDYHMNGNALYALKDKAFRVEYLRNRVQRRYRRNARVPFADGCSGTAYGGYDVSLTGYLYDLPMNRDEWRYVTQVFHRFRATDRILNMGNAPDWRPWRTDYGIGCRSMLVHGKSANNVRNIWDPAEQGWTVEKGTSSGRPTKTQIYCEISRFLEQLTESADPECTYRFCHSETPYPPRIFMDWVRAQLDSA